jgi:hypothetical protein
LIGRVLLLARGPREEGTAAQADRVRWVQSLEDALDAVADRRGFSGVVRVDRSGGVELLAGRTAIGS